MIPPAKLLARRCLSQAARWALRLRSRPFPFAAAARTWVLSPHPDDESLGCGGVIPQIVAAGHAVHVTYVTDGGASHPGVPGLVEMRRAEAIAATSLLGLGPAQLDFLNVRDGTLAQLEPAEATALVTRLAGRLDRLRPTLVLLPCAFDGSSEHEAAYGLFERALAESGLAPRVLEFPVWSWWNPLRLPPTWRTRSRTWRATFPGQVSLKARALAAHVSQVRPLGPGFAPLLTPDFISFFTAPEEFFFEQ